MTPVHSTDPEAHTLLAPEEGDSVGAEAPALDGTGATVAEEPGAKGKRRGRRRKKTYRELPRGSALGRYVVLDRLGVGGMGVVYAAYDPELDRRVAIKLLQTVEDAPEDATAGHARLLREAQAMARLTHPNVIAVYDVGTFEDSVFVAMEFVAGTTMTAHMDLLWEGGAPPWREVLRLYAAAGRGLAAAHAAGIVHRDFKPDNIMVGQDGRVLVLDFGLARPTGDAVPLSSGGSAPSGEFGISSPSHSASGTASGGFSAQLTKTGTVMGTPAYMSPEQMTGTDTDAPTDQFSFGVALYQGLYGERPFAGDSFADLTTNVLRNRVREPPRKSKVPTWLRRATLVALARKPEERYASMNALLAAIQRDPGRRRRNALFGVAGAGLLGAAVLAGVRVGKGSAVCRQAADGLASVWNAERAESVGAAFEAVGKAYASDAHDKLTPVLQAYADDWSAQRLDACQAARVRGEQSDAVMGLRMACLDRRLHRLDTFLEILEDATPAIAAESLSKVHQLPRIEACADVAALSSDVPPPDDPEVAKAVVEIRLATERAIGLAHGTRYDESEALMGELLTRAEGLNYPPIEAEVLGSTAELMLNLGRGEETRTLARRGLLLAEAAGFDRMIVSLLVLLAGAEGRVLNNFERARQYTERAAAVMERRGNLVHDRIVLHGLRGGIARSADRWDEAEKHYEAAWALRVEAGISEDPSALITLNDLGMAYIRQDKLELATEMTEKALQLGTSVLGPSHPNVAVTLAVLGRLSSAKDDYEQTIGYLQRARTIFVGSLGPGHSNVAAVDNGLGLAHATLGQREEALAAYRSALEGTRLARGPDHLDVAAVQQNLGNLLRHTGRTAEAIKSHEVALAIKLDRLGKDHVQVGYAYDNLGDDYRVAKDYEQAMAYYDKSIALFMRTLGPDDPSQRVPARPVPRARAGAGDARRALAEREPRPGPRLRARRGPARLAQRSAADVRVVAEATRRRLPRCCQAARPQVDGDGRARLRPSRRRQLSRCGRAAPDADPRARRG